MLLASGSVLARRRASARAVGAVAPRRERGAFFVVHDLADKERAAVWQAGSDARVMMASWGCAFFYAAERAIEQRRPLEERRKGCAKAELVCFFCPSGARVTARCKRPHGAPARSQTLQARHQPRRQAIMMARGSTQQR